MKRTLLALALACAAFGQNPNTAVFPGSVATDSDLLVASNRASTTTTAAVAAGDTSISVSSTSSFIVPTTITFTDNGEIAKCTAKTASSFTSCTRGFDSGAGGIAATAHASGATVQGFAVAHYFNQLAVEVKALETAQAADISNPMSALGDTMYGGAAGAVTRLAGNTTTTKKFLTETGDGVASAAPGWNTIAAGDVPTLNQSTTGNAATATALAGNPTETGCQATSVPTTVTAIDASANLTCTAIGKAAADGLTFGVAAFTATDFDAALGVISLDYTNGQKATDSVPGFLSAADHTTYSTAVTQAAAAISALTTDVTATGPGSVVASLVKCSICTASQAMVTDASKNVGSLAYGTAVSATSLVERDSNSNAFANNFVSAATSIASAGGTTNISGGSARYIVLTGTSAQTFRLPNATTLSVGARYEFNNNSTGLLTVTNLGGTTVLTISASSAAYVVLLDAGTTNGSWDFHYWLPATNIPQNVYNQTIQEEGSGLTQRATLNFIGPVTCADNSGSSRTDCTVPNRQITMGVGAGDITSTGVKACSVMRAGGTIQGAYLIANALPTGANLVIDVMKIAFSSYTGSASPTSITASAVPTIATTDTNPRYSDTTLTGWTTTVSAGDVVCVKINTAPTGGATWASLTLEVK